MHTHVLATHFHTRMQTHTYTHAYMYTSICGHICTPNVMCMDVRRVHMCAFVQVIKILCLHVLPA